MKKRGDRFLIWALAISLSLHAVILLGMRHMTPVEAKTEPPPTRIVMEEPPPTPKPPPATPQPIRTHPTAPSAPVAPPKLPIAGPSKGDPVIPQSTDGPGPVTGIATSEPSAAPTDTPKPQCSVPYAPARVIDAITPTAPEDADAQTGTAQVRVDLAPTGAVVHAAIYRSAGNMLLDQAALRAARSSTYRAETKDCALVGGSYLFTVDFTQ